jgi:uncharacterized membrane protein
MGAERLAGWLMRGALNVLTLVSALGAGWIAGIFIVFSTTIMKALGTLPPAQGIAAMQSINVVIVGPWFLTPFFGTAVGSLLLVVAGLVRWHAPVTPYWLAGSALYLAGALLVTVCANVPRNAAMVALDPNSAEAVRLWADYLEAWTAWNHVRAAAALAAAVCFTLAYRRA